MSDIIIRIPWNRNIAKKIMWGCVIVLPLLYIIATHGVTKYRLGPVEDPYTENTDSWIVTLRYIPPFVSDSYEVCMDGFTSERVYFQKWSGGFDMGRQYYDKDGSPMSRWTSDDTGTEYLNGEISGNFLDPSNPAKDIQYDRLFNCRNVPKWFFNWKVQQPD